MQQMTLGHLTSGFHWNSPEYTRTSQVSFKFEFLAVNTVEIIIRFIFKNYLELENYLTLKIQMNNLNLFHYLFLGYIAQLS